MAEGLPQGFPATVLKPRDLVGETISKEAALQNMQPAAPSYDYVKANPAGGYFSSWDKAELDYYGQIPDEYYTEGSKSRQTIENEGLVMKEGQKRLNTKYGGLQGMYSETDGAYRVPMVAGMVSTMDVYRSNGQRLSGARMGYDPNELYSTLVKNNIMTEDEAKSFLESNYDEESGLVGLTPAQIDSTIPEKSSLRPRADYTDFYNKYNVPVNEFSTTYVKDGVTMTDAGRSILNDKFKSNVYSDIFSRKPEYRTSKGEVVFDDESTYVVSDVARTWAEDNGLIKGSDYIASTSLGDPTRFTVDGKTAKVIYDNFTDEILNRQDTKGLTRRIPVKTSDGSGKENKAGLTVVSRKAKDGKGYEYDEGIEWSDGATKMTFEGRGVQLPKNLVKVETGREGEEPKEYNLGQVFVNEDGEMFAALYTDISDFEKIMPLLASKGNDIDNKKIGNLIQEGKLVLTNISDEGNERLLNAVTSGFSKNVNSEIRNPNDLVKYLQGFTEMEKKTETEFDWGAQD